MHTDRGDEHFASEVANDCAIRDGCYFGEKLCSEIQELATRIDSDLTACYWSAGSTVCQDQRTGDRIIGGYDGHSACKAWFVAKCYRKPLCWFRRLDGS